MRHGTEANGGSSSSTDQEEGTGDASVSAMHAATRLMPCMIGTNEPRLPATEAMQQQLDLATMLGTPVRCAQQPATAPGATMAAALMCTNLHLHRVAGRDMDTRQRHTGLLYSAVCGAGACSVHVHGPAMTCMPTPHIEVSMSKRFCIQCRPPCAMRSAHMMHAWLPCRPSLLKQPKAPRQTWHVLT